MTESREEFETEIRKYKNMDKICLVEEKFQLQWCKKKM